MVNMNNIPDHRDNLPQGSIKVEVNEDGISGTVIFDTETHKAIIPMPEGLDEKGMEEWKRQIGDGSKLIAAGNRKLQQINSLYGEKEKQARDILEEAEKIRQEALKEKAEIEALKANLGATNPPSNMPKVKPIHEFLGLKSADDMPNYIAENPADFSVKNAEYIASVVSETVKTTIDTIRQNDQAKANEEMLLRQITQEGLDARDFLEFCTNLGTKPNSYALATYKTLKAGPGTKPAQGPNYGDVTKYQVEFMPPGAKPVSFEAAISNPALLDTFTDEQLKEFNRYVAQKRKSGGV